MPLMRIFIAAGFMLTGLVVVELSTGQGIATLFQEFLSQTVILVLGVTAGKLVRSREILAAETATRLRLADEERAAEAGRVVAEERLPSSVYWAGLGAWGIRLFPGSTDSLFVSLRGLKRRLRPGAIGAEKGEDKNQEGSSLRTNELHGILRRVCFRATGI